MPRWVSYSFTGAIKQRNRVNGSAYESTQTLQVFVNLEAAMGRLHLVVPLARAAVVAAAAAQMPRLFMGSLTTSDTS